MVQSGSPKIIVKTDNEPANLKLEHAATRLAREETAIEVVPEESNEYVSQTGGFVEQAVQVMERKVRTLKFSAEDPQGVSQPSSSCLGSGIREPDHESLAQKHR